MAGNTLIEAKGIYKSFSGVPVLQDVHFEVKAGEVHALMGENGAGKSTLMSMLFGMYTPDLGEIRIKGKTVRFRSSNDAAALNIGMHAGKLFVASGWSPVTVFFVIYCVALTVFSVATYIIAAHRRALERNQQNEEE